MRLNEFLECLVGWESKHLHNGPAGSRPRDTVKLNKSQQHSLELNSPALTCYATNLLDFSTRKACIKA